MQLFASTRPEFDLLNLDAAGKQMLISMQFNAQKFQYDESYPQSESRIILRSGEPVGRILVDRNEREILLVDIALLPEHRNGGIGTRFVKELIDEASATNRIVRLQVFKTNPALHLYERLGFEQVADQSMYLEMICKAPTE